MTAPEHRVQFGRVLQGHRLAAGLSQEELAEQAGLSRRGISDLERGRRRPLPATARRRADALHLDGQVREDFLEGTHWRASAPAASELVDTHMPITLSGFVGRQDELAHIQALLQTARLLTLTGRGGVGKTRLAPLRQ